MSDDKKDLTRIEDLAEYLHEIGAEEEEPKSDEGSPVSIAELTGLTDTQTAFNPDADTSPEEVILETQDEFPVFPMEEAPAFESSPFETAEFSTTDFSEPAADFPPPSPEEFTEIKKEEIPFESAFPEEPSLELEEPKEEKTEILSPPPLQEEDHKAPENFDDLKKFAESSNFTGMATEGNPSFSVLIKDVRYVEDVSDILTLMRELGLITDSEEQMKGRLMRGSLLVPRISEYAAVFLAHKLRRFDVDIQVGLSDEIHPPKHHEAPETGMVSKFNLYQNQSHSFHFDDPKLEISQIIVSATSNLEGYQVVRYLGVASEHKMIEGHLVEDETSDVIPHHYQELAQKLKAHALKASSNAVVGINYQLTPIPSEFGIPGHKYRLSCTGNLVWVNKL